MTPMEVALAVLREGKRLPIPDTNTNLQMLMRISWAELPDDRPNFEMISRLLSPAPEETSDIRLSEVRRLYAKQTSKEQARNSDNYCTQDLPADVEKAEHDKRDGKKQAINYSQVYDE